MKYRETKQPLLPKTQAPTQQNAPHIYPSYPVVDGQIAAGYEGLAALMQGHSLILIDGFIGILWDRFRQGLEAAGIEAHWISAHDFLHPESAIETLVEPFLGDDDPIFGTRFTGQLSDFFDTDKIATIATDTNDSQCIVIYGEGAFLTALEGLRIYVDIPKNEVQYRSRAASITNLGVRQPQAPKVMYKRFYFVDWVALNKHKAAYESKIDVFVDGQDADCPMSLVGDIVRATFEKMSHSFFRVRPWFESGIWGGQWIKNQIPSLTDDVPNYAWSFEMIAPEQGIILEQEQQLLELSFDWLMYHDRYAILGQYADNFGYEFPIRFDFLDTFDGGNLSVQCHPRPEYIRKHFGEHFTQDETYYILDCEDDATVYLGFQAGVNPDEFHKALTNSIEDATEIDIPKYVQVFPAKKGDLFLIPNGTIHCSGINNMVLEISATPYIFTFKMYDWMRVDGDGNPRPINIKRAMDNLYFERQGDYIGENLIAQPSVLENGAGWRIEHLPTDNAHFYDIHRYFIESAVECATNGSCQIMMVVEGSSINIETDAGMSMRFNYAETFIVPANTGKYKLINKNHEPVTIIQAFMKADWFLQEDNQWLKSKIR